MIESAREKTVERARAKEREIYHLSPCVDSNMRI